MKNKLLTKLSILFSILIGCIALYTPITQAEKNQQTEIMMDKNLIKEEVHTASKKWIGNFNKGNIKQCSEAYSENAVMDARPMDRFKGRAAIFEFWTGFVNATNAKDLVYTDIEIGVVDENSAILSAKWSMNVGKGFITKELWVKTDGVWLLSEDDFTVEEQF